MFRPYERGCARYKPTLRLTCAAISFFISVFEFWIAIMEYFSARSGNILGAIFTGIFCIHGLLTLIYFVGMLRQRECLLLPFLTCQLIVVTSTSLFVMVWWIATILSFFDLVEYKSPIESLNTSEFFCVVGIVLLISLIVLFKVSLLLYKGYKAVEMENIYKQDMARNKRTTGVFRKRIDRSLARSISSTIPPSQV